MWLAIDTATDQASVAVGHRAGDAVEEVLLGARRHASGLVPMVDRLLARAGVRVGDLEGILVADGPGSFTGLRVGAALAKSLARAGDLPVWTASTLMIRAHAAARDGELVLAVANALRGEVYAAAYRFEDGAVETVRPPEVGRSAEALANPAPDRLVGDAPADLAARLEAETGRSLERVESRARELLELRLRRGGAFLVGDAGEWEPMYGRPAEAQARWESAHGRRLPDPDRGPR